MIPPPLPVEKKLKEKIIIIEKRVTENVPPPTYQTFPDKTRANVSNKEKPTANCLMRSQ